MGNLDPAVYQPHLPCYGEWDFKDKGSGCKAFSPVLLSGYQKAGIIQVSLRKWLGKILHGSACWTPMHWDVTTKKCFWGSVCQNAPMSKDEEITRTSGGIREGNRLDPFIAAQISTETRELHKHCTREASLEVLPLAHIPFKLL